MKNKSIELSGQDNSIPVVKTVGLKKYFKTPKGDLHAVDDVNISIDKGKTLGVVGESGCGKSTLGRTILKILEPTSGQIFFNGEDITHFSRKKMQQKRKDMQIIFQDPYSSLNPRMSVAEIIAEPMIVNTHMKSNEILKKVEHLMSIVGLSHNLYSSYPHELDGGRRQRIGVARSLALEPEFIVCDEPVSALDVSIQAQILNLLMDLQDEFNLTYMFITHDLSVVRLISDEIMVLYLGQCIEKAPTEKIFINPMHPYTRALLSAIPRADLSMRNAKQHLIKGEVVSPINPPAGCRFANRCNYTSADCTNKTPEFREVDCEHYVSCHYAEKIRDMLSEWK